MLLCQTVSLNVSYSRTMNKQMELSKQKCICKIPHVSEALMVQSSMFTVPVSDMQPWQWPLQKCFKALRGGLASGVIQCDQWGWRLVSMPAGMIQKPIEFAAKQCKGIPGNVEGCVKLDWGGQTWAQKGDGVAETAAGSYPPSRAWKPFTGWCGSAPATLLYYGIGLHTMELGLGWPSGTMEV